MEEYVITIEIALTGARFPRMGITAWVRISLVFHLCLHRWSRVAHTRLPVVLRMRTCGIATLRVTGYTADLVALSYWGRFLVFLDHV